MSTQEALTQLFNAIALGFMLVAAMDFGTRLLVTYKQFSVVASLSLSAIAPTYQSPLVTTTTPQTLPPLPKEWLLPLEGTHELSLSPIKLIETEQKHLRLLPQAKEISIAVAPKLEDLLLGINLDKLKLRQARRIAKLLGIAQKINGKDQKLTFLCSQIKLKLQQKTALNLDVVAALKGELKAC